MPSIFWQPPSDVSLGAQANVGLALGGGLGASVVWRVRERVALRE